MGFRGLMRPSRLCSFLLFAAFFLVGTTCLSQRSPSHRTRRNTGYGSYGNDTGYGYGDGYDEDDYGGYGGDGGIDDWSYTNITYGQMGYTCSRAWPGKSLTFIRECISYPPCQRPGKYGQEWSYGVLVNEFFSPYECSQANRTKVFVTAYPSFVTKMDDKSAVIGVKIEFEAFWFDKEIQTKASSFIPHTWKPEVTVSDMSSNYKNVRSAEIGFDTGNRLFQRTSLLNLKAGANSWSGNQQLNLFYGWERIYEVTQRGHWDMRMFPFDERDIVIMMPLASVYGADSTQFVSFYPFEVEPSLPPCVSGAGMHNEEHHMCKVYEAMTGLQVAAKRTPGYTYTAQLVSSIKGRTKIPGDWVGDDYILTSEKHVTTCLDSYPAADGSRTADDMEKAAEKLCVRTNDMFIGSQMQGRSQCWGNTSQAIPTYTCQTPTIHLTMKLQRVGAYTFMAKMMPVSLCSFAAYASVWTPVTTAMPRFAASIIPFLTAANIMNGVTATLPTSAYGCYIVVWLVIQLIILCCLVVDTMIMFRLFKQMHDDVGAATALATINHYDKIPQAGYPVFFSFSWFWAYAIAQGTEASVALVAMFCLSVIITVGGFLLYAFYVVFMTQPPLLHQISEAKVAPEPLVDIPYINTHSPEPPEVDSDGMEVDEKDASLKEPPKLP